MGTALLVCLFGIFAFALFWGAHRIIASKTKTPELNDDAGAISLPRGTALLFVVGCIAFVGLGVTVVLAGQEAAWSGWVLILLFSYGVWCTLIASHKEGSVVWDKHGIEGPSRLYPIPFFCNRKRVSWQSVLTYQDLKHGLVFLNCKDGSKLVWSNYFAGAEFLKQLIHCKCPWAEFK